jgi:hypothetical protein
MTPGTCILLGLSLIAVTGCAGVDRAPVRAGATPGQPEATAGLPQAHASQDNTIVEASRADTSGSAAPVAPTPIEAPALAAIEAPAAPPAPTEAPAPPPAPKATKAPPAKAPVQPTKAAATQSPAAKPAATARKPVVNASTGSSSAGSSDVAATAKTSGGQALNLATLEKRLKDTSAIGVMTKITIKNQVDELLERFRAHHAGRDKTPLEQLRQPFDTLILKVLSLVQDKDPSLASTISASREALWAMLTDRSQFSNL